MAPRTYPQKRSEMVGICRGQDLGRGPDMPSCPCGVPRRLPLCHPPLGANVPSSRAPGLRRLRGGAPSALPVGHEFHPQSSARWKTMCGRLPYAPKLEGAGGDRLGGGIGSGSREGEGGGGAWRGGLG